MQYKNIRIRSGSERSQGSRENTVLKTTSTPGTTENKNIAPNSQNFHTVESRLTASSSVKAEKRVRWGEDEERCPYLTYEDYKAYKNKCKGQTENQLNRKHYFFDLSMQNKGIDESLTPIISYKSLVNSKYNSSHSNSAPILEPYANLTDDEILKSKIEARKIIDKQSSEMAYSSFNPANQQYKNLFPCYSQQAIQNRDQLGFQSFKDAKKTGPLKRFLHKKFTKTDPVKGNMKFFRQYPNLKEFAKVQPLAKEQDIEAMVYQQRQEVSDQQDTNDQITFNNQKQQSDSQDQPIKKTVIVDSQANHKRNKTGKGSEARKNWLMMKKNYFGIYDRFPPGQAWYNNTHVEGQLGNARPDQHSAIFYSKMHPDLRIRTVTISNNPYQ